MAGNSLASAKASKTTGVQTLLGIEGTAAREYFFRFDTLLKGDVDFRFEGRNRRPPRDPVNALLSFVYAILTKELAVVLQAVGFDPMLGFFHQPRYGRPSLAANRRAGAATPWRRVPLDRLAPSLRHSHPAKRRLWPFRRPTDMLSVAEDDACPF
jgi:CRISPR-associated endonuclease Cas1